MPARYDTIIVVRKRNARGDEVEYHTVGRKGPSIWRTGEPNPPGTPGYQAAYDAAIGLQAALAPPATGHGWHTVDDLLDAYERSREFCRLAPRTRTDYLKGLRRRAGQVRQRAARHRQQRRAQGQRARLDRGALGRQGRRQAPRPVQVRAQLGDRAPPRAGAGQLPARHPALLRGRRSRRDHLGGRRGRPLLPPGPRAACGRGAARAGDRPAHRRPRRARAQRDQDERRMAAARSSCVRTSGGGAS